MYPFGILGNVFLLAKNDCSGLSIFVKYMLVIILIGFSYIFYMLYGGVWISHLLDSLFYVELSATFL
ncbi:hypothetical protein ACJX0J_037076, partial [Zea mays]